MKLYVQVGVNGEPFTIEVLRDAYIMTVKEIVKERTGIDVKNQEIYFAGRILPNNTTLSQWNIEEECLLRVILAWLGT